MCNAYEMKNKINFDFLITSSETQGALMDEYETRGRGILKIVSRKWLILKKKKKIFRNIASQSLTKEPIYVCLLAEKKPEF